MQKSHLFFLLAGAACLTALTAAAGPHATLFRHEGSVELWRQSLTEAGYETTVLTPEALCAPGALARESCDLLVLVDAGRLPSDAAPGVAQFLESGGSIIALGAPLWREQTLRTPDGNWMARDEFERATSATPPEHVIADFGPGQLDSWKRANHPDEGPALYETVAEGPAPGMRAMHCRLGKLHGWDNLGPEFAQSPFPAGHTLTVFSAKGTEHTGSLAVEWVERDGSRWIATVPLSPEWRRYVLTPEDFKFWESNPDRAQDRFRPENAVRMDLGMSFSHTGLNAGPHEYWVGPFGTAAPSEAYVSTLAKPAIPALEILSPGYKFFQCSEVAQLGKDGAELPVPNETWSCHPRPLSGFDKGRSWRWIPLVEAVSGSGDHRGTPVSMMIHADGKYKGGRWVSFSVRDKGWYETPEALALFRESVSRVGDGVYVVDGGANFYTYFDGQPIQLGLRIVNVSDTVSSDLVCKAIVAHKNGYICHQEQWPLTLSPGELKSVAGSWTPPSWPDDGLRVTAQLERADGSVVGTPIVHDIHVWRPKTTKQFVTVNDGEFEVGGQRWRPHGVNYMPSTGVASEDGKYFEQWVGARSYDSAQIGRDLRRVKDMGFNAVSVFLYHESMGSQNFLDLLRQCEALGLRANVSLRPGTPLDFEWAQVKEMIEYYRFAENDTVFAYDLAWEPMWMRHAERTRWDADWEAWLVERYGSVAHAERDWGYAVPRDASGKVTNPQREQLMSDGDWRRMSSAYRRFLDTVLYRYYSRARTLVRGVDPNHLVSFRMTEAGDPTMAWDDVLPYDFPYLAAAVDILEPEAYGRVGDWERIKPGWFEFEYARWSAPHLPMIWGEAGVSAWDVGAGGCTEKALAFQGTYLRDFYRMMLSSGADGIFWWWYPGGFRWGENSDYGVLNPDGSDRPATSVIREHARAFVDAPRVKPVDAWIEIDRDARADGVTGIYTTVKDEFWRLVEEGKTPGLRTAGTGTDSGNCPLVAVGNTPCDGSNPPKYLDAFFDSVEIRGADGAWVAVEKDGQAKVAAGMPVVARIRVTNLGEASWRADGDGAVRLTVSGLVTHHAALAAPVPHFGAAVWEEVVIVPDGVTASGVVVLSFEAAGRTGFGEKYAVGVAPDGA